MNVLSSSVTTVYVRKEEEKVYNAILMDSLTVHDFKLQVIYRLLVSFSYNSISSWSVGSKKK